MAAAKAVKEEGKNNDLLDRIASDPSFGVRREDLDRVLSPENYVGLAPRQTAEYLKGTVRQVLEKYRDVPVENPEISV